MQTDLAISPTGDVWVMENWQTIASCHGDPVEMLSTRCGGQLAAASVPLPALAQPVLPLPEADRQQIDALLGVGVVTTPPTPFLLSRMQPGETRTLTQQVAVNYLDDPTPQDYSGMLQASYTDVGVYQVTVPAGTYNAIHVRLQYEGEVGPAHTKDTAYYFFAPQVGVVAMIA